MACRSAATETCPLPEAVVVDPVLDDSSSSPKEFAKFGPVPGIPYADSRVVRTAEHALRDFPPASRKRCQGAPSIARISPAQVVGREIAADGPPSDRPWLHQRTHRPHRGTWSHEPSAVEIYSAVANSLRLEVSLHVATLLLEPASLCRRIIAIARAHGSRQASQRQCLLLAGAAPLRPPRLQS